MNNPLPLIIGIQGCTLTKEATKVLKKVYGVILFGDNIIDKNQLIQLVVDIKNANPSITIYIDQEGGGVQRIKPPISQRMYSPLSTFGDVYETNPDLAKELCYRENADIMNELREFGLMPFGPVADVVEKEIRIEKKSVIADRSAHHDPKVVIALAGAAATAILDNGGKPCFKHIPGHGATQVDSHHDLPFIGAELDKLDKTHFVVFRELSKRFPKSMFMLAHVLIKALDPELPVTISKVAIGYIKRYIIQKNDILVTDCLSMGALSAFGTVPELAHLALAAGCDYILYGKCDMSVIEDIIMVMTKKSLRRKTATQLLSHGI